MYAICCLISRAIQLAQQQQQQPTAAVPSALGAAPAASGLDAHSLRADPRLAALQELAIFLATQRLVTMVSLSHQELMS